MIEHVCYIILAFAIYVDFKYPSPITAWYIEGCKEYVKKD
jgi:hypothetical protein